MKNSLYFRIPDDVAVMGQIIQSIPHYWTWMSGSLEAPQEALARNKVAIGIGYEIGRGDSAPKIIAREGNEGIVPGMYLIDLMLAQKFPHFLDFHEAYSRKGPRLAAMQKLAVMFVESGFRGRLSFPHSHYRDTYGQEPALCRISLLPFVGHAVYGEAGPQPARVSVEWNQEYGGGESYITSIVETCKRLGLEQYEPVQTENESVA